MIKRLTPVVLVLAVFCAAFSLRFVVTPEWVSRLTDLSLDSYQQTSPIELTSEIDALDAVFVAIDEPSLREFGQWPWDRNLLGRALISLYEQGASVVLLDLLLAEADRVSPSQLIAKYPILREYDDISAELQNEYGYLDHDEFLADVLAQTPTVLAIAATPQDSKFAFQTYSIATIGPVDEAPIPEGNLLGPIDILAQNASLGHVSVTPGLDQLIRSIPLLVKSDNQIYPSLVLGALANLQGTSTVAIKAADLGGISIIEQVKVGDIVIPTDPNGSVRLISQTQSMLSQQTLSFQDALSGDFAHRLEGRVVILGAAASGLGDINSTVNAANIPGPLIHVNLLNQIRAMTFLPRASDAMLMSLMLACVVAVLSPLFVLLIGPIKAVVMFLMLMGAAIYLCWFAYLEYLLLLDWVWVAILGGSTFFTALGYRIIVEESQKRFITGAFSTYLSPDVVRRITDQPDRLVLGGETRNLTVMFADIRGFTTISEYFKDEPERLAALLNRLLTPLTEDIQRYGGTVDKYMGDAIMAFWNAPLDDADDALHACEAALAMIQSCEQVNLDLKNEDPNAPDLKIGIGINKGLCTVGNLGSDLRFDYSCVGDSVNLAARLEGVSKKYGVNLIVSGSVLSSIREGLDQYRVIPLDRVVVVGKKEPVLICTLFEPRDDAPEWVDWVEKCFYALDENDREALEEFSQKLDRTDAPEILKAVYTDRLRRKVLGPRSLDQK